MYDFFTFWLRPKAALRFLEFRILADLTKASDKAAIERARLLPVNEKLVTIDGEKVAEWMVYSEKELGPVDKQDDGIFKRQAGERAEVLVLIDPWNVTGQYLTSAERGFDNHGKPAVHLGFDRDGARRFGQLTNENKPQPGHTGSYRRLGIILDKQVISAPSIPARLFDRALISGSSITESDVDAVIAIFHSGVLPYPIRLIDEKRVDGK